MWSSTVRYPVTWSQILFEFRIARVAAHRSAVEKEAAAIPTLIPRSPRASSSDPSFAGPISYSDKRLENGGYRRPEHSGPSPHSSRHEPRGGGHKRTLDFALSSLCRDPPPASRDRSPRSLPVV